ncbi:hypothetical protein BDV97DRAFT_23896 [Delphinella strobiligena]|nr:hypothetical protein BDV97DRAFT_23896 [Delphinella strobiligena]
MAELLLENGADPNIWGPFTYRSAPSPLYTTTESGKNSVVELLLCGGANVNEHGGPLGTALQAALLYNMKETIDLLRAAGAVEISSNKVASKDVTLRIEGNQSQSISPQHVDGTYEAILDPGDFVVHLGPRSGRYYYINLRKRSMQGETLEDPTLAPTSTRFTDCPFEREDL